MFPPEGCELENCGHFGGIIAIEVMEMVSQAFTGAAADIIRSGDNLLVIESAVFRCVVIH